MNVFPEEVHTIVADAVAQFPDDIDAAVDSSVANIRELDCYASIVDDLVRNAIRDLVHGRRHTVNVAIKREAKGYGGQAKVKFANSEAVNRVMASVFDYSIGSRSLGSLTGADLLAVKDSETAIAKGHQANAKLCERLAKLVPPEKTVRESVAEKKLAAIFKDVGLDVPERQAKAKPKREKAATAVVGRV